MLSIVFTVSDSFVSKAIRWVTKSETSHVAIGTEIFGVPVFMHSTVGGVQITPRERYLKNNRVVAEYVANVDVESKLRNNVMKVAEYLGEKYDYIGLVGYAILIFAWRLFRKKIKNPLASPTAMVCSEFVVHLNADGDIPEWDGLDPERTHPQELLERCEKEVSMLRVG